MTLEHLSPNEWIANIGASTHMIDNLGMLENLCHYFRIDALTIDDGSTHAITYVDDTYINYITTRIKLQYVLLVLALVKNILSIG